MPDQLAELGVTVPVWIHLGNVAALDNGQLMPAGWRTTEAQFPIGRTHAERLADVVDVSKASNGFWAAHSAAPPAWVESNDPQLEADVAAHYGCPIGRPDIWPVAA